MLVFIRTLVVNLLLCAGIALVFTTCNEDEPNAEPKPIDPTEKPNLPPDIFSAWVSEIGIDYAIIRWNQVSDPNADTVYLQVFLDGLPVSEELTLDTTFTISNLRPLKTSEGYVQATDKKSKPITVPFSFRTKSKITVFDRLYPDLAAGTDMVVLEDGGFVSAMGLNRYDSLGNFVFYQRISPPSYGPQYTDLLHSSDGNFLFGNRFNIQKFDSNGNHLWTSEGFDDRTVYNAIEELPDGGYLAVGNNVDLGGIIQKFDSEGKKVWLKHFDLSAPETMVNCTSIVKTQDGDYVVTGSSGEFLHLLSLSKIDAEGNILWVKNYSSDVGYVADAEVILSSDGSFVVGARTMLMNNAYRAWVLKLADNGDLIWDSAFERSYGTQLWSIIELRNGEIVFVGANEGYSTMRAVLMKISSSGELILSKEYYPDEIDYQWLFVSVAEANDGGLIIMGGKGCLYNCTEQGSWILKTDNEGNF